MNYQVIVGNIGTVYDWDNRKDALNSFKEYKEQSRDGYGLGDDGVSKRLLGYIKAEDAKRAEGETGYDVKWDEKTIKVRNLDYARSSACWPEATDEQLCLPREELTKLLIERLPALMIQMYNDITNFGFTY